MPELHAPVYWLKVRYRSTGHEVTLKSSSAFRRHLLRLLVEPYAEILEEGQS